MNDRRKTNPTPIQVFHERPPLRPGQLHTVNATDMKDYDLATWIEKRGYHTAYVYLSEGVRCLSFFESDKLDEKKI